MKQIDFDAWVIRNHAERNPDCDECSYYPSNRHGTPCRLHGHACPRLQKLLDEYNSIRKNEERKMDGLEEGGKK